MNIKCNLKEMNKNKAYKILLKKIQEIKNIIHIFLIKNKIDTNYLYELSDRQNETIKLAYTKIKEPKEIIDGYYNIIDFIYDCKDGHEGKLFWQEKIELIKLIYALQFKIEEDIIINNKMNEEISKFSLNITRIDYDMRAIIKRTGDVREENYKLKIKKNKEYDTKNNFYDNFKLKIIEINNEFITIKTNIAMNIEREDDSIEKYNTMEIKLYKNKINILVPANKMMDCFEKYIIRLK